MYLFFIFICICFCHTVVSVSCSLVVTCGEMADLLDFLYVMFSCVLSFSLSPPLIFLLTVPRQYLFYVSFFHFYLFLLLPHCGVRFLQPCGHLWGNGWPLGFLVRYIFLCFVILPFGVLRQMWHLIVS